jgi:serine/threonine protein kinase
MFLRVCRSLLARFCDITRLQVLRYLHSESRVLHRDISAGNVMYVGNSSGNSKANLANLEITGAATATALSHSPDLPVFIKYLLHERYLYPH